MANGIKFGNLDVSKLMLGTSWVDRVYLGSNLIYTIPEKCQPLYFMATQANSTVELYKVGSPTISNTMYRTVSASGTAGAWTTFTPSTTTGTNEITLTNIGDCVQFMNTIGAAFSTSNYLRFNLTGEVEAYGNINSLYAGSNYQDTLTLSYNYCFYNLFYGQSALKKAPVLPATTLSNYCYYCLFRSCTGLTSAPELPATTLSTTGVGLSYCYGSMFYGCTSLITPPALPATTLVAYCYSNMFRGCTSLTSVPALLATRLVAGCYTYMFNGCKSLYISDSATTIAKYAWRLPTTGVYELASSQRYMFTNCLGTRSSNDLAPALDSAKTYYTQNEPVAPVITDKRTIIYNAINTMSTPAVTISGQTATLTFTPFSSSVAEAWGVSGIGQVRVLRRAFGGADCEVLRRRNGKVSSVRGNTIRAAFGNRWTMPWQVSKQPSTSELTSGSMTIDISRLFDFSTQGHFDDIAPYCGDWTHEFEIGFVYFDEDNCPTIFKTTNFEIYY